MGRIPAAEMRRLAIEELGLPPDDVDRQVPEYCAPASGEGETLPAD